MSLLLFFIDGLGIGERNGFNPLSPEEDTLPLAIFKGEEPKLPHDGVLIRTDARLGVEGRPQSASGQTTILTGINAAKALGYHKQGFPNLQLRELIAKHSIFLQLKNAEVFPMAFANAYGPPFFESRPRWVSATTVAVEAANLNFRTFHDLAKGEALFHDYTNRSLIAKGYDIAERTPDDAASILIQIAKRHRFTLYEYFLTDTAGHEQNQAKAREVLRNLAKLLKAVLRKTDLTNDTVIVTSDHGNVEDLSVKNHTLNDVPTLIWGKDRHMLEESIRSLTDIAPAIVKSLTGGVTDK
jgi:2,3-bisphosphoglycerate-independent phosphoglycerate mutase